MQSIEGHLRLMLLELESRVREEVDAGEPIVAFMPEYAAYFLNRLEVGKDGKRFTRGRKERMDQWWEWSSGNRCSGKKEGK